MFIGILYICEGKLQLRMYSIAAANQDSLTREMVGQWKWNLLEITVRERVKFIYITITSYAFISYLYCIFLH